MKRIGDQLTIDSGNIYCSTTKFLTDLLFIVKTALNTFR